MYSFSRGQMYKAYIAPTYFIRFVSKKKPKNTNYFISVWGKRKKRKKKVLDLGIECKFNISS